MTMTVTVTVVSYVRRNGAASRWQLKDCDSSPLMTSPQTQISGKYHFQVDLKGLPLPVTFTIPDIPDSPLFEKPLGRSHSWIVPDEETHVTETAIVQQPQSTITNVSGTHTDSLETHSHIADSDMLRHLSVSTSLLVRILFDSSW
jgi:hypothetical protein